MGCCLGVILLGGAPRLALFVWWLADPSRVLGAFARWTATVGGLTAPMWVWPLAGFVFLPWTTVAYVFVAPGGITTLKWIVLVVALLIDLSTHGGSGRAYRSRRSS
jgi:hypothetical protein